jgi:hypothetical protein
MQGMQRAPVEPAPTEFPEMPRKIDLSTAPRRDGTLYPPPSTSPAAGGGACGSAMRRD